MQPMLWPRFSALTGITLLALYLAVSGRHKAILISLRQLLFSKRQKRVSQGEQVEEEHTNERQQELSLTAPPQIQPLRTPEELLTWQEPWHALPSASPGGGLSSSVRPYLEYSRQSQAFSTAQAGDVRPHLLNVARERHTTFCAAPVNMGLHNRAALASTLASNGNAAPIKRDRQQGWDATSPPCLSSAASPMSAAAGEGAEAHGPGTQHVGSRPQLLVCHDMQGGYLDDRFVQGGPDDASFRLWRWDTIDIFVYFSHHLVTIPPPSWICAAHRNNTKVLGTFITEWAEGSRFCKHLFSSRSMVQQTADQLVRVARYHGFDGWLINIECELHPAKTYIPHLLHFLAYLRARMREVCGSHAAVIWYDAVTTEGQLRWQNNLTTLNYPFLDACDGLFLNYHWKSETPTEVAASAGSRACNVYMGVDVHGRGTFGGGKMTCDIALLAARMSGVSAAIFGPGWVHENFPEASKEEREDVSETFWRRVVQAWGPRPVPHSNAPTALPFVTSFCEAKGRCHWIQGCCVSATPWYNLASLDLQPALLLPPSQQLTDASGSASSTSSPPDLVLRKAWLALDAVREGSTTLQHSTSYSAHVAPHTLSQCSGSGSSDGSGAYKEGSVSLLRGLAFNGASSLVVQPPLSPSSSAPPLVHPLYHTHILVPPIGLALTYALTHPPSTTPVAQPSQPLAPLTSTSLQHGPTGEAAEMPSPSAPAAAPTPAAAAGNPAAQGEAPAGISHGQAGKGPEPGDKGSAGASHPNLAIALWLRPTAASPADATPCIFAILPPGFATSYTEAFQAAGLQCVTAHQNGAIPSSSNSSSSGCSWSSGSINAHDQSQGSGGIQQGNGISADAPRQSCCGVHQASAGVGAEPWQLWQLRVDAGALPYEGAVVVGAGIACASAVRGAAHDSGGAAVCLGHLALSGACCPAPSSHIRSGLHARNISTLSLSEHEQLLSCDVSWERELGFVSAGACALQPLFNCYHVWVQGINKHGTSEWLWLGAAHSEIFHCAVVVSSSVSSNGQPCTSMQLCRPNGHALHVLEGKAPSAAVGSGASPKEDGQAQSVNIAVQPVRAVDGLLARPLECCSQLRVLLAQQDSLV